MMNGKATDNLTCKAYEETRPWWKHKICFHRCSLPIWVAFHAVAVNVMFPSELCQWSSKPC